MRIEMSVKIKNNVEWIGKIDFIIANHAEIDHSGALPALMERIPDTPVYCAAQDVKSLKGHYH